MDPTQEVDPSEIADVLDKAHDEMMIRGRFRGTWRDAVTGRVCTLGAVAAARGVVALHISDKVGMAVWNELAERVPTAAGRGGVAEWNDAETTTDDDVFDLLRSTAKELREQP